MYFEMDTDIIPGEMDNYQLCHVMEINLGPLFLDRKNLVTQDVVFGNRQKDPGIYLIPILPTNHPE